MKFIKIKIFLFLIIIGCSDHEKAIECGCHGAVKEKITSDPGIMVKVSDGSENGFHFLSLKFGYFDICSDVPQELQIDGLQVKISGTTRIPCIVSKSPLLEVQHYPFDITSYEVATDSLFVSNRITIKLFPYQSPVSSGYGYAITSSSGLKIYQETIAVVGGLQTFSTPTKSFKVAVLVGHKMMISNGLPTLVIGDLYYLNVLSN